MNCTYFFSKRELPNDIFGALMTCRVFSSWSRPAWNLRLKERISVCCLQSSIVEALMTLNTRLVVTWTRWVFSNPCNSTSTLELTPFAPFLETTISKNRTESWNCFDVLLIWDFKLLNNWRWTEQTVDRNWAQTMKSFSRNFKVKLILMLEFYILLISMGAIDSLKRDFSENFPSWRVQFYSGPQKL